MPPWRGGKLHGVCHIVSAAKLGESLRFWITWAALKILFCQSKKGSECLIRRELSPTHSVISRNWKCKQSQLSLKLGTSSFWVGCNFGKTLFYPHGYYGWFCWFLPRWDERVLFVPQWELRFPYKIWFQSIVEPLTAADGKIITTHTSTAPHSLQSIVTYFSPVFGTKSAREAGLARSLRSSGA